MNIQLKPQWANHDLMVKLETLNIISRLTPGGHTLDVKANESRHETVYATDDAYGPHKLICVTINSETFDHLVYHSAPEEFLIIDKADSTPLVLIVALINKDELQLKIKNQTLAADDLVAIILKPNDPFLSFFTMQPLFAHVEICMKTSVKPPSFYVTESRDIDENVVDFKSYTLTIERI